MQDATARVIHTATIKAISGIALLLSLSACIGDDEPPPPDPCEELEDSIEANWDDVQEAINAARAAMQQVVEAYQGGSLTSQQAYEALSAAWEPTSEAVFDMWLDNAAEIQNAACDATESIDAYNDNSKDHFNHELEVMLDGFADIIGSTTPSGENSPGAPAAASSSSVTAGPADNAIGTFDRSGAVNLR
jgi:hypothetical protein